MHAHRLRHVEVAEHLVEHRHEDRPAADAEDSGQQARDDARSGECEGEHDEIGDGRHDGSRQMAELGMESARAATVMKR